MERVEVKLLAFFNKAVMEVGQLSRFNNFAPK
jgi:hypothetical protein